MPRNTCRKWWYLLLSHALEERRGVIHIIVVIDFAFLIPNYGIETSPARLPLDLYLIVFLLREIGHGFNKLFRVLEAAMRATHRFQVKTRTDEKKGFIQVGTRTWMDLCWIEAQCCPNAC